MHLLRLVRASAFCVIGVALTPMSLSWAGEVLQVDPGLTAYKKISGISGNINSIGSDTLNNLMTLWAEGFRKQYPNVKIQIEGKGSSTAPPALIEGTAQLGPMSRKMKGKEIDKFEKKFGYKPMVFPVAVDALAVYVNKDNPIQCMSLDQVDAAFSKTRRLGNNTDITTWGKAGLHGRWMNVTVSLYGRNSASGTYGYFKKQVLKNGDYKDSVKEQPGSASVVQGITEDRGGLGYSGIGYRTSGVRPLPLSKKQGATCYEPSFKNSSSGKYPLARFLYVYVNKVPDKALSPLVKEFMKFMFSSEGQKVVVKDGYYPLPASLVEKKIKEMS